MRVSYLAAVAVGAFALLAPAGCVGLLAVGSGAIAAATSTDCLSPSSNHSISPTPRPVGAPEDRAPSTGDVQVSSWCDIERAQGGAGFVPLDPSQISAPSQAAAVAVASALAAVGRGGRYVAEGNGPRDFDCSGLTAFAWRQAGVRIADLSYTQWDQTTRVPRELVAPGDLVFWFGGNVHHVAIVTAVDGSTITIAEAANPDTGLRVRTLGGSWDASYLSGFGRVNA